MIIFYHAYFMCVFLIVNYSGVVTDYKMLTIPFLFSQVEVQGSFFPSDTSVIPFNLEQNPEYLKLLSEGKPSRI